MGIEKLLEEPFFGGFFYTCVFLVTGVVTVVGLTAYGFYRKSRGKDLSGKRRSLRAWD